MKYRLKIVQDEDPSSPREWDNLGTMICFHGRYSLGDKHEHTSDDFSGWSDMKSKLSNLLDGVLLPLYLYDHSGITMNTTGFNCPWDSGQVGYIGISKAKIRKEYGVKNVTKKWREKIATYLVNEVETYDQYLRGDVWGYEVEDEDGDIVDSCYGYYGEDHAKEEGECSLKHYATCTETQTEGC